MFKQACLLCKIVGVFAILGALNWGFTEFVHVNLVDKYFAPLHMARVAYGLITLSGLALIVSYFTVCPACKK